MLNIVVVTSGWMNIRTCGNRNSNFAHVSLSVCFVTCTDLQRVRCVPRVEKRCGCWSSASTDSGQRVGMQICCSSEFRKGIDLSRHASRQAASELARESGRDGPARTSWWPSLWWRAWHRSRPCRSSPPPPCPCCASLGAWPQSEFWSSSSGPAQHMLEVWVEKRTAVQAH